VRVLVTSLASRGHLHPLIGLVRALFDEGHDVDLATGPAEPTGRGLAMFAGAARELLGDLDARRPDAEAVLHEEGEWAGPVYAAVLNVPSIAVGWGAPLPDDETLGEIDARVAREVDEATDIAERSGVPEALDALRGIYADPAAERPLWFREGKATVVDAHERPEGWGTFDAPARGAE